MTDDTTIEIRVRLRDSPQEITGLRVRWESSNDALLRIAPVEPGGDGLKETLVAQLRAAVTGVSSGFDTVRVAVERGAGFVPAESSFVIQVTQKWVEVSAGKAHTCGRTVDSLVYCWGQGPGNGRPFGNSAPAPLLGLGDLKFVAVSAGELSSCGVIREHLAYCWGSNANGRLGNGDLSQQTQLIPSLVSTPTFDLLSVGSVVCGLAQDRTAWCWGANVDNQLGQSLSQQLEPCPGITNANCSFAPIPVFVGGASAVKYRRVSVGGHHACGISQLPDSSLAFCWGKSIPGALGNGAMSSPTPVPVTTNSRFTVIAAGGDHTCGITTSGATYCWGSNSKGQLGIAGGNVMTPGVATQGAFDSITAGGQHTCALASDGKAYCWGYGSSGQLGDSSTVDRNSPVTVRGGLRFKALSAGEAHTCGVTSDGSLYCWGQGTYGQLGTGGDFTNRVTPTRVAEP